MPILLLLLSSSSKGKKRAHSPIPSDHEPESATNTTKPAHKRNRASSIAQTTTTHASTSVGTVRVTRSATKRAHFEDDENSPGDPAIEVKHEETASSAAKGKGKDLGNERASKRSKMSDSASKGKNPVGGLGGVGSKKGKNTKRGGAGVVSDPGSGRKPGRYGMDEMEDSLDAFGYDDMEDDFSDEDEEQEVEPTRSNKSSKTNSASRSRRNSGGKSGTAAGELPPAEAGEAKAESSANVKTKKDDDVAQGRYEGLENALRLASGGAMSPAEAEALLRQTRGLFGGLYGFGGGGVFGLNIGNKWQQVIKKLQSPKGAVRLETLHQAAEDLAISMEEQMIGFPTEPVVKELLAILEGKPTGESGAKIVDEDAEENEDDDEEDDDYMDDLDEDAQLARVLAMSAPQDMGGQGNEEDMQAALLACRCLANLLEVTPGSSHIIVALRGVQILCSKLFSIEYIELAEQVLQTLEKLSTENPGAIVREGGLQAMLQYLDFFSTYVQRTALTATANCCRSISPDYFSKVQEVLPTLRSVLSLPDQRLVEQATLAIIRVIESYRTKADLTEQFLDPETLMAINNLLAPSVGSSLLSNAIYTHLLRALTQAARISTKVCLNLYEAQVPASMYFILTGVLPSSHADDSDLVAGNPLDAAIMQNVGQRPKEQIEEALACICELLPPLPKDGIFDPRNYSEKMIGRYAKAKAKLERDSPGYTEQTLEETVQANRRESAAAAKAAAEAPTAEPSTAGLSESSLARREALGVPSTRNASETYDQKMEQFNKSAAKVSAFIDAVLPSLVDVFSASASTRIRSKVLIGLVKSLSFSPSEKLKESLKNVPLASFLSSILSSRDDPSFVLHALQMVEILLNKLPDVYNRSFHREGVFFEIGKLADEELSSKHKKSEGPSSGATPSQPSTRSMAEQLLGDPMSSDLGDIISRLEQARTAVTGNGSSSKRSSSVPMDPSDANIVRARVVRIKKNIDSAERNSHYASGGVMAIKEGLECLKDENSSPDKVEKALKDIAQLFLDDQEPLSSFELLQSGLLDGLMEFVTVVDHDIAARRRNQLMRTFMTTADAYGITALSVFIKRLQESLSRMENFEVETASTGSDDSRRSPLNNLVRQLRIRLKADDTKDVPKVFQDMVVSVQAIAPVSAVSNYLRQKVSSLNATGGRGPLSSMYAALAGGGGINDGGPKKAQKEPVPSAKGQSEGAPARTARRRSSARLKGKDPEGADEAGPSQESANDVAAASASAEAEDAKSGLEEGGASEDDDLVIDGDELHLDEDEEDEDDFDESDDGHAMFFEGGMDDDLDDDDMEGDADLDRPSEKTVDLSASQDDAKPQAVTPQGTRVATPQPTGTAADQSRSSDLPPKLGSYASAVKTSPSDWHFEFKVGDEVLQGHETIFGALHRALRANADGTGGINRSNLWMIQPTIHYHKVDGPPPLPPIASTDLDDVDAASPSALPPSLPATTAQATVLRMLRVLHSMYTEITPPVASGHPDQAKDDPLFINLKLTAKFIRQLEELVIVASDCLPDWAVDLPTHFPFLFPFEARYTFLQSTSFGHSRLIGKYLAQQSPSENQRRSGMLDTLPRPQRSRVRIIRPKILESASRVMELYGPNAGILEIEYQDEPGTGLGPTLEFYTLVSKAFAQRSLQLWHDEDSSVKGDYVFHPHGLFPRPLKPEEPLKCPPRSDQPYFKTLGTFVGKALLDSRIIDLDFNPIFMSAVLGHKIPLTTASLQVSYTLFPFPAPTACLCSDILQAIDPALSRILVKLEEIVQQKNEIENGGELVSLEHRIFIVCRLTSFFSFLQSPDARKEAVAALTLDGATMEDLSFDFTVPGHHDLELKVSFIIRVMRNQLLTIPAYCSPMELIFTSRSRMLKNTSILFSSTSFTKASPARLTPSDKDSRRSSRSWIWPSSHQLSLSCCLVTQMKTGPGRVSKSHLLGCPQVCLLTLTILLLSS